MTWDTVVIGAGFEGLTAGAALARAGHRVLVLEQRDAPGGSVLGSTLQGRSLCSGARDLSDLHEGGSLRRLFEGLGVGADLTFCELDPDALHHYVIGRERLDQPRDLNRWVARLSARFPRERAGIARYFDVLTRLDDERRRCAALQGAALLRAPLLAPTLCRWGLLPLSALLDACVKDRLLRALLAAQRADHGIPPERLPIPLHAAAVSADARGAYVPRGGTRRIAHALLRAIRRRGGEVRTRTRVTRILVERGRAVGVETALGERILASRVVCGTAMAIPAGRLPFHLDLRLPGALRDARLPAPSLHCVRASCAVDLDLRAMGSGHHWWRRDAEAGAGAARGSGDIDALRLSITTLQDPGHRKDGLHTLEMTALAPRALVARGDRELGARILAAAEHIVPGVRRAASFLAVDAGAPLPPLRGMGALGATRGALASWLDGVPLPWPGRPLINRLYPYRSGAAHDLASAARAGLLAAQRALGLERPEDCLGPPDGAIRVYPADRPEEWLPALEARRLAALPRRLREAA